MYYDYTTLAQFVAEEPSVETLHREEYYQKTRSVKAERTPVTTDPEAVRAEWLSRAARFVRFA